MSVVNIIIILIIIFVVSVVVYFSFIKDRDSACNGCHYYKSCKKDICDGKK